MSSRGVDCAGVTVGADGIPEFAFICDCGSATSVAVVDLAADSTTRDLEFAYTCDGCQTSHWMTIERTP